MNSTTATHDSRKTKPLYQDMSVQVFAGMALGALIGWLWPQSAEWMRTLGDLFIRLITMFVGLINRESLPYGTLIRRPLAFSVMSVNCSIIFGIRECIPCALDFRSLPPQRRSSSFQGRRSRGAEDMAADITEAT